MNTTYQHVMNNPFDCPHFEKCPGCTVKRFSHPPIYGEMKAFFQAYGIDFELEEMGFEKTRLKAKLAVQSSFNKEFKIGLYQQNSHDVLAIPFCLVHHPSINEAVFLIQKAMKKYDISAYDEKTHRGALRYLQCFVEQKTGRVQLSLVINEEKNLKPFLKTLFEEKLLHSIWLNFQREKTNQIFGDRWEHVFGDAFLWQKICHLDIPFHPGAFSQVHLPLFEKLIEELLFWVEPKEKVLELFAGVGAIGLNVLEKTKDVTLVENNPYAKLSFDQMKKNIPYHLIDANKASLDQYDLIIVDPPRKGLEKELLSRLKSNRLIYVSCGFRSFQRDTKELISLGWTLEKAKGYLLFPGTNHVETLALFQKR